MLKKLAAIAILRIFDEDSLRCLARSLVIQSHCSLPSQSAWLAALKTSPTKRFMSSLQREMKIV
jgi:hypothetical protein